MTALAEYPKEAMVGAKLGACWSTCVVSAKNVCSPTNGLATRYESMACCT